MKTDDFNFDLPEALIAQFPPERRGSSRLFVLDRETGARSHSMVSDLVRFVEPGTLMVFNDSRVRKARLYARATDTGAEVEFLLLSMVPRPEVPTGTIWRVMTSKARKQKPGRRYEFPGGLAGWIADECDDEKLLEFERPIEDAYLDRYGHVPLPPYIKRSDDLDDSSRYQTVYARETGSAACPTAGLHFTPELLEQIEKAGIRIAWVTLHVGLGTFLPVRVDEIEKHRMHEEAYTVPEMTALAIAEAKREGRKVLAVGTTSLRTLESAWAPGRGVVAGSSSTGIFIYPGYGFKVVDRLFTNFHTPKSTLLMLVAAFAGRDAILDAYAEAIREGYRFFSYGDAMLIR